MARIFLAGAENTTHLDALLANGVSNILVSFYYLSRRGQVQKMIEMFDKYPTRPKLFLDSGAFSFQAGTARIDVTEYFHNYCVFVREYGHMFEFAAELDVDEQLSLDQLREWRDILHNIGTVPIIPVWHANRGYEEWDDYCKDPRWPHLGLGSANAATDDQRYTERQGFAIAARLVNKAHYFNKTVHGFAQTKILTSMKLVKYDTVDSTSWKGGERYGQTFILDHNKWHLFGNETGLAKKVRLRFKHYFESIGCNFSKIVNDDIKEIRKANIIAWENLNKRMQIIHTSHVGKSLKIRNRDGSTLYTRSTDMRGVATRPSASVSKVREPRPAFGDAQFRFHEVQRRIPSLERLQAQVTPRPRPAIRPEASHVVVGCRTTPVHGGDSAEGLADRTAPHPPVSLTRLPVRPYARQRAFRLKDLPSGE